MKRCLQEHGLSIAIVAIWLALLALSLWRWEEGPAKWINERAGGHSDDAFGAMLLVLLTKWLREKNSSASN